MKRAVLLLFVLAIFANHSNAQAPFDPQFTVAIERTTGLVKVTFYFPSGGTWQVQVTTESPGSSRSDSWRPMQKPYFESFELGPNRITYHLVSGKYPRLFFRAIELP